MLTVAYDPVLVAVSVALAIAASFTGLQLTIDINALAPAARKVVIAKAAVALGMGIWSMHFVGMLAVRLPIVIAYDALPTLLSALLAILVLGLGLILLHFGVRTQQRIVAAGCLTGLGIALMHYLDMAAVRGNSIVAYDAKGVALAIAIAVIASILALEFAYRRRTLGLTVLGGIVLGVAISAMHYAAMVFTTFALGTGVEMVGEPLLSSSSLDAGGVRDLRSVSSGRGALRGGARGDARRRRRGRAGPARGGAGDRWSWPLDTLRGILPGFHGAGRAAATHRAYPL